MKLTKSCLQLFLIILIIQLFNCSFLEIVDNNGVEKEQKHFITIQSNPLHLSKSLFSKQQITLPFQRIFTISSSLQPSLSKNIINFSPTTIKLSPVKHSTYIQFDQGQISMQPHIGKQTSEENNNSGGYSILYDLRTPFPIQISQIVVASEKFIIVYIFPAQIIVLQENQNYISVKTTYQVEQFENKFEEQRQIQNRQFSTESISFYPMSDSYVLGYLKEFNEFFLFDDKGYILLLNDAKITNLQHIHSLDSQKLQFFTAQRQRGFKHCRINLENQKIEILRSFDTFQSIGLKEDEKNYQSLKNLSIYDVSFDHESQQVYLLDINIGVIKFNYSLKQQRDAKLEKQRSQETLINTSSIIIKQRGCSALDYISNDRLVLICEHQKRRFFVQAYFSKDSGNFFKQSPVFHNCNSQDIEITPQFYITFQSTSIDIFWPSRNNFIPELIHNKKHINLLGMQTFKITHDKQGNVHLYSVRNNILIKEKIQEEEYSLQIGSATPIARSFSLSVFGSCEILHKNLNDRTRKYSMAFHRDQISKLNSKMAQKSQSNHLCQILVPIQLQVSKYIVENRGDFALASSALIVCVLVAFSLICICLKKYLGIQKIAKQTLMKLQSGQKIPSQFVV